MKKFLILALVIFGLIGGIVFYLINPNDPQYKSYYSENQALRAYSAGDIETYFKNMDRPVSVKYHSGSNHLLSMLYAKAGRFDDAIRVTDSFVKHKDYSYCMPYKPFGRLICRVTNYFDPLGMPFHKDNNLARIYFVKGDYKTSLDYVTKSDKDNACFNAKLYAYTGDFSKAQQNLKNCKNNRANKLASGIIKMQQKKYTEAEQIFKNLINPNCVKIQSCNSNSDIYSFLGELYLKQGKKKDAALYYKKVIEREPYDFNAKENLLKLRK